MLFCHFVDDNIVFAYLNPFSNLIRMQIPSRDPVFAISALMRFRAGLAFFMILPNNAKLASVTSGARQMSTAKRIRV